MGVMGQLQEATFRQHGKCYGEALLWSHLLGLPLFLVESENIGAQLRELFVGPGADADGSGGGLVAGAGFLGLLAANLLCCHACKSSFFELLGATSSLTATLAITTYRFIGIVVSAMYFNAPPYPPVQFWGGVLMTLAGSLSYLVS